MSKISKKSVGVELRKSGANFRVWAPFASSVSVVGSFNNWSETELQNDLDGHWSTNIKGVKAGQEYKFVIRNGKETYYRSDPRALYFPTSAGSSVISNNEFDWGDDSFTSVPLEKQIIYELHVGTFNRPDPALTGTFRDVCEKLDHLAKLGINMIELMPIGSMMMDRGWGYAIDHIFAVESLYGGRRSFMQFVKAAHQRGIGVILDVVYNHFGPDTSMDLWQFDGWHQDDKGGIYFYNDWRAETPWGNTRPDYGRQEVQQYILDNVNNWVLNCRVDGLRVDSVIYIRNVKGYNNAPGTNLPEGWQLLQKINNIAKKINPSIVTIAEDVAENEYIVKDTGEGGAGFTSQWEVGLPYSFREALKSSDPQQVSLAGICGELTRRYNDNVYSRVIFVDSHDSASNNGASRLCEQIAPGRADTPFAKKQSLIAATILLTAPGIPMLLQGQEFLESGSFNDWQGLDWEKTNRFAGILEAYEHLISLRKNANNISAGLTGQGMNLMHVDDSNKVIAYHRWNQGGPKDDVVVVINFANRLHKEYALGFPRDGVWQVRFNSTWNGYGRDLKFQEIFDVKVENGIGNLVIPPSSAIILSQDK